MKGRATKKLGLRRVWAVFMASVLLFLTTADWLAGMPAVYAAEDLILKLHYHREDGNYDGWDVWLWEIGGDGGGYAFEEEDGGMVATKVVTPGVTSIGFIVRTAEKEGDLNGTYYTYTAVINGEEREACDPYARTTGVNGKRAMVIDLASTNPQGWETDSDPNAGGTYNDAVIYELHVRDLSSDPSSGIENTGKFLEIRMNNLAAAIYLTSEGIPFMQAGEEMLRTKMKADGIFDENSYASPDFVNSLKWDTLDQEEYRQVFEYYKGLIAFRKAHGALRLTNAQDVEQNVIPVEGLPANMVAFQVNGGVNGEVSEGLFLIFNPNNQVEEITLPDGVWDVYVNGEKAGTEVLSTIVNGKASVDPISALVLVKGTGTMVRDEEPPAESAGTPADAESAVTSGENGSGNAGLIAAVCVAAVVAAAGIGFAVTQAKKKRAKNNG